MLRNGQIPVHTMFRGKRPSIADSPRAIRRGSSLEILVGEEAGSRSTLLRLGSVTHALDSNQRLVELIYEGDTALQVKAPTDPNLCRPGIRAVPVGRGSDNPDQPEGGWHRPRPDRRRHRDPLRSVVGPRVRSAGDRPRAPHRPDQAHVRLRMIAAGTIEDKLLLLQQRKSALAEALWSDDPSTPARLDEEDIVFLLGWMLSPPAPPASGRPRIASSATLALNSPVYRCRGVFIVRPSLPSGDSLALLSELPAPPQGPWPADLA